MASSNLIRLGGLAAMVGGAFYASQALLWRLVMWLRPPDAPVHSRGLFYLEVAPSLFLVLGAMAAIVALYALQREHYRFLMALASLVAFVGVALSFLLMLTSLAGPLRPEEAMWLYSPALFLLLLMSLFLGIIALGILTVTARVLPWWCGVALIAGSLLVDIPIHLFVSLWQGLPWPWAYPFVGFFFFLSETFWLLGVPWAVVGYAIFRAGSGLPMSPSRLR